MGTAQTPPRVRPFGVRGWTRHPRPMVLCIAIAAASAAAGVLSLFYLVRLGDGVGLNDGALIVSSEPALPDRTLTPLRTSRLPWPAALRKSLLPSASYGPYRDPQRPPGVRHFHARVPLWIPAAGFLLLAFRLRVAHLRRRPGRCMCGYDLRGNAGGVCPECGRRVNPGSV